MRYETLRPHKPEGEHGGLHELEVPGGLGVEDFKYLRTQTDRPVKATCPGPVMLSIHVQTGPGDASSSRPAKAGAPTTRGEGHLAGTSLARVSRTITRWPFLSVTSATASTG